MGLQNALVATSLLPRTGSFERLREHIPMGWIDEALEATGVATLRRRRLPAEQVLWLVLGIALFRDRPIEAVVDALDIALPSPRGAVARSAIPRARERLGEAPVKHLFERAAKRWSDTSVERHRWRGLAVYGVDGSKFRIADTEANRAEFGGWTSGKGDSSNPLVRGVTLVALRSHVIRAARFAPYAPSAELTLARTMLDDLPQDSLTVFDALYLSVSFLSAVAAAPNRHWLIKAKSNTKMKVLRNLAPDDDLVELETDPDARARDRSLPRTWRARAIRYRPAEGKQHVLMTSLLDPERFPADELRDLYHERWELELAYDELKTEMLDAEVTLRSKSPNAVRQELWGVLLAFNLVRVEMEHVAAEANVVPTRVSFAMSLALVREEFEWSGITRSPGAIPRHLGALRERLKRFILPPRRPQRRYPREIKNDYRRYPRRKTGPIAK
jgi:hypothetical protein